MNNHTPRILVVDDEPGVRITLEGIIEDEGYEVAGAANGYEALKEVQKSSYDRCVPRSSLHLY